MKVRDVITQFDTDKLVNELISKQLKYPANSLSPRELVRGLDFSVSREEAEKIVAQFDSTISSAIMDFKYNPKKK